MSLPIIFFHLTNSEYLLYSLLQAKQSNPNSPIFLLGDSSNNYQFVEHKYVSDYAASAVEFSKIYKHLHNINPYDNEILCFQRWFVIRDFMALNNINKCLCLDSDLMLYADLEEEEKKFAEYDLTLSQGISPHCVFVNSLSALEKFCSFVTSLYTDLNLLKSLEQTLQECSANNVRCGVSDMTVFNAFKETQKCHIGETSTIIEGSRYDHNISLSEGFEVCEGIKNIYFLEGQPFCKEITSGQSIKFNALHFQGKAKKFMKDHFRGNVIFDELSINLLFKLREINLIIFPNWTASEEILYQDIQQVIRALASHPNKSYITLLVDTHGISEEDASLFLSSVAMHLLMQENLDVIEGPEVSLVGELSDIQWKLLQPRIHTRIILDNENQQAIAQIKANTIPSCPSDSFNIK